MHHGGSAAQESEDATTVSYDSENYGFTQSHLDMIMFSEIMCAKRAVVRRQAAELACMERLARRLREYEEVAGEVIARTRR